MAHKPSSSASIATGTSSSGSKSAKFTQGDYDDFILQAIVIGDSFNERFMPITLDKPRCLLPLVNIPLIEYTFECLAVSGVQEVFLIVKSHADQIKQYISKSRWGDRKSTMMQINVIILLDCNSVGEALRECDAKQLLRGPDFLLVHGDLVSNINLGPIIAEHVQQRKKDKKEKTKGLMMTMMLKKATPFHRSRERGESAIFIIDHNKMECIGYSPDGTHSNNNIELDAKYFENRSKIAIRYDLMDCNVDICSLNVLALLTENFDYQDMRNDFLTGILQSDILSSTNRIACHVINDGYAARVRNPHLYDSISKDILERWTWPLVPELDITMEHRVYCTGHEIYMAADSIVSRNGVQISEQSLIGPGVVIGEGTIIKKSVIGPNCNIGANVYLENAYIWDKVRIEHSCRITSSIISDRSVIKHYTIIEKGCLITSNVMIGPKVTIPQYTRIAKYSEHYLQVNTPTIGSYPSDDPAILSQHSQEREGALGIGSDGIIWNGSLQMTEEGDLEGYSIEQDNPIWNIGSDYHTSVPISLTNITTTLPLTSTDNDKFYKHAIDLLTASISKNSFNNWDNIALELNSLKFAHNASLQDVLVSITRYLAPLGYNSWQASTALIAKFVRDPIDQILLSKEITHRDDLSKLVPLLYKLDILEEDVILDWSKQNKEVFDQIGPFVQWLEQADSESGSE